MKYKYPTNLTGDELLISACKNLNLNIQSNYCIKYFTKDGNNITVDNNMRINEQQIINSSIIFVLEKDENSDLSKSPVALSLNNKKSDEYINITKDKSNSEQININIDSQNIDYDIIHSNYPLTDSHPNATNPMNIDIDNDENNEDNIDENPILLQIFYQFDENSLDAMKFFLSWKVQTAITHAKKYLAINDNDNEYVLMCFFPHKESIFLENDMKLEQYDIIDSCSLHLFKKYYDIVIKRKYFKDKTISVDITQKVSQIIEEIAKDQNIQIYHDYTLSHEKLGKMVYLNKNIPIPFQSSNFTSFNLIRRYFIFSREDLLSQQTAVQAVIDCREYLSLMKIWPSEEQIIDLIYYSFNVLNNGIDIKFLPPNLSLFLPNITLPNDILEKIKHKYENLPQPDLLNAARLYLKTIRSVPGFGCEYFDAKLITYEGNFEHKEKITLVLSPICLILYKNETNDNDDNIFVTHIFYQYIKNIDTSGRKVSISYLNSEKLESTITLLVLNQYYNAFTTFLNESTQIIRDIFSERAKLRSEGHDIGFSASFDRVNLCATTTLKSSDTNTTKKVIYDKALTGKIALEQTLKVFALEQDPLNPYIIMIIRKKGVCIWIDDDTVLGSLDLIDNMVLYLTKRHHNINIHFSDGSIETVIVDVKNTISHIITDVFEKRDITPIEGFTFFVYKSTGKMKALDNNLYIIGQSSQTNDFYLRRRFFILTNENIEIKQDRIQTANDINNYFMTNDSPITLNEAVEMSALYRIITSQTVSNDFSFLSQTLPHKFNSEDEQIQKLFLTKSHNLKQIDNFQATKKYLKMAQKIKYFGSEKYKVQLEMRNTENKKNSLTCTLYICPLYICFVQDGKEILSFPWKRIGKIQYSLRSIVIYYTDDISIKTKQSKKDMKEITIMPCEQNYKGENLIYTISILISNYLKNMKSMIKKRIETSAEKPLEILYRINGKYKDSDGNILPPQVDLYIGKNPLKATDLQKEWFDINLTGNELTEKCVEILGLDDASKYVPLVYIAKYPVILKSNQMLKELKPLRKSFVFIIKVNRNLKIKFDKQEKIVECSVTDSVIDIKNHCCGQFDIIDPNNFAMFTKEEHKPLNENSSLIQQVNPNSIFILKRYYFSIPKLFSTDDKFLSSIFKSAKHEFIENRHLIQYNKNTAIELATLDLIIEKKSLLLETDIKEEDITNRIPNNIKISKADLNFAKDLIKTIDFSKSNELIIKYINVLTLLKDFTVDYIAIFINNSDIDSIQIDNKHENDKPTRNTNEELPLTKAKLFVSRCGITISLRPDFQILFIPISNFISMETMKGDLNRYLTKVKITYIDSINYDVKSFLFYAISVDQIRNDIIHFKEEMAIDLLKKRIENNNKEPTEFITLVKTNYLTYNFLDFRGHKIEYDTRWVKNELIEHAIHESPKKYSFNENFIHEYDLLIEFTKNKYEFVDDEKPLGFYPLNEKTNIIIINKYIEIKVSLETKPQTNPITATTSKNTFPTTSLIIEAWKNVNELLPLIAESLCINFNVGYVLYCIDQEGHRKMLDMDKPIPVQTLDFQNFALVREYFSLSSFDLRHDFVCKDLFDSVKDRVLSGLVTIDDTQLISFAIYQTIIETGDRESYQRYIPKDFNPYLPKGYEEKESYMNSLLTNLQTVEFFSPEIAIKKYITEAFRIHNFSATVFNTLITICKDFSKTSKRYRCFFNISFKGCSVITKKSQKELYNFSFDDIYEFNNIDDYIYIGFVVRSTLLYTELIIKCKDAKKIFKIIQIYKKYFLPLLQEREASEKKLESIQELIKTNKELVKISVANRYNNPATQILEVPVSFSFNEVKDYICTLFKIPNINDYSIFIKQKSALLEIDLNRKVNEYDIGNDIFILIPTSSQIFIRFDDCIYEESLQTFISVFNTCIDVMRKYDFGFSTGFTLAAKNALDNSILYFSLDKSLIEQNIGMNNSFYLTRRFFILSIHGLEDYKTLKYLYKDSKHYILRYYTASSIKDIARFLSLICLIETKEHFKAQIVNKIQSFQELLNSFSINFVTNDITEDYIIFNEFKQSFNNLLNQNISKQCAIYKFLLDAFKLEDFGSEKFEVFWNSKEKSLIQISPYFCKVHKQNNPNTILLNYKTENIQIINDSDPLVLKICHNDVYGRNCIESMQFKNIIEKNNFESFMETLNAIKKETKFFTYDELINSLEFFSNYQESVSEK